MLLAKTGQNWKNFLGVLEDNSVGERFFVDQRGLMHDVGYWYLGFMSCLFSQVFGGMGTRRMVFVQWTFIDSLIAKIFTEAFCLHLDVWSRMEQRLYPHGTCRLKCLSKLGQPTLMVFPELRVFPVCGDLSAVIPVKSQTIQKINSSLDPTSPGHGYHL